MGLGRASPILLEPLARALTTANRCGKARSAGAIPFTDSVTLSKGSAKNIIYVGCESPDRPSYFLGGYAHIGAILGQRTQLRRPLGEARRLVASPTSRASTTPRWSATAVSRARSSPAVYDLEEVLDLGPVSLAVAHAGCPQ